MAESTVYKPLRGVHFYLPGRTQIPFFKRVLAWLADLGYNTLFLEIGGGLRYDRHPAINAAWERFCAEATAFPGGPAGLQRSQPFPKDSTHTELGGSGYLEKAEVADLVSHARGLGIDVIPEVQTFSHSYYLCGAYPEIAERADDPWPDTYCPSNPRTYEIVFDVLEEVIEVCAPRTIHIGHDELYHIGLCPRCRDKSGAELLAHEVLRIHDFLAERGVRTALWGDKLLPLTIGWQGGLETTIDDAAKGTQHYIPATYQAIERMPRDLLILEWLGHVDPRAAQFFLERGFEVVSGNFGDNFAAMVAPGWTERSADPRILGAEVSTWCEVSEFALGYNGSIFNMLFAAHLLRDAEYRDDQRAAVTARIAARMPETRHAIGGVDAPSSRRDAVVVPVALDGAQGEGQGTAALPDGVTPAVRIDAQHPHACVSVDRRADSLIVVHTCEATHQRLPTWSLADPYHHPIENLIAVYSVRYADGQTCEIPIHYGSHIARWDVAYGESIDAVPYWADPVIEERVTVDRPIELYRYEWMNPRPDVPIAHVTLNYGDHVAGVVWITQLATCAGAA